MPFATLERRPPRDPELAAWLRLTLARGIGGATQRQLLTAFGSPEAVFSAPRSAVRDVIGARAEQLFADAQDDAIAAALDWAAVPGQHILTLADAAYPPQLLNTADPPSLLYVRGDPGRLAQPALAVVGSRNATPQGLRMAEDFARTLADAGFCIVSGLALGIDAAAHRGALECAASTVAVIGTGADRLYPARHQELARRIVAAGAIVSEFPLGTAALAANFPRRNRIIAGLAQGVLVVEAAPESGSLITARLAAEQGREVFAIPGSIHAPLARGCHRLIKEGAKLVESASDILEELQPPPGRRPQFRHGAEPSAAGRANRQADAAPAGPGSERPADDEATRRVLQELGDAPCAFDSLAGRSALTADALLAILMSLELEGRIAALPGNCYQRLAP
jgi:DNA processing protein